MTIRKAGVSILLSLFLVLVSGGCTGGSESEAADSAAPARESSDSRKPVDAKDALAAIHPSIPLYQGAKYHDDLTRRDEAMVQNEYGPGAEVFTLATDDSFPQVYHYYTTYLAQFRAFPAQNTYPPERKNWRTLEVQLNQAMQDPFFPGDALDPNGRQVTLQIAETEAQPRTVIRYIVTPRPAPAPPVATAASSSPADPVAR